MNRLYNARKEAGLCAYCGKVPPTEGYVMCDECRKKVNAATKKSYSKHAAARNSARAKWKASKLFNNPKLCHSCLRPKEDDEYLVCKACRAKNAQSSKLYRDRLIANKICVRCKKPLLNTSLQMCDSCRFKLKKYLYERSKLT